MKKNKFCFFIISCKKNVSLLDFQLSTIKKALIKPVEIFVSMDDFLDIHRDGVTFIGGNKYDVFGDRIYSALKTIPFEFIIVMCDDFIVEKTISQTELEALVHKLSEDRNISSIALAKISGKNTKDNLQLDKYGDRYVKRSKYSIYKTTLQCALWNRIAFMKLMKGVDSPWEFELFRNCRTFITSNSFYALKDDLKQPIVYNRGRFIIRGRMVEAEKKRLEIVFNKKINISGFELTNSYLQNDALGIIEKILRRVKLIYNNLLFRVLSLIKNENLNNN